MVCDRDGTRQRAVVRGGFAVGAVGTVQYKRTGGVTAAVSGPGVVERYNG